MGFRRSTVTLFALMLVVSVCADAQAGKIHAVRGYDYKLTPKHGPWMVMVAAFRKPEKTADIVDTYRQSGQESNKGMTPRQAADELVFELRTKGVPAYVFEVKNKYQRADDVAPPPGFAAFYKAFEGGVCVLAGNYKSSRPDDRSRGGGEIAHRTLEWIKGFEPKFLTNGQRFKSVDIMILENGGLYKPTPGQKGPLGGAFLTVNPMQNAQTLAHDSDETLLKQLNYDVAEDISLLKNQGKYTLVIATSRAESIYAHRDKSFDPTENGISGRRMFSDDQIQQIGGTTDNDGYATFLPSVRDIQTAITKPWSRTEDLIAQDAEQMTRALRSDYKIPAYVWHDKHYSLVTVGSFNDRNDPEIAKLAKNFGAKMAKDSRSGQEVLIAESISFPREVSPERPTRRTWLCDPVPSVMEVPKF
ncbi:hypothetical protein [Stratiformator vulcanicus]|uniref:Caspase domain protein n=1 Tax=Stratiformator vulcanicus TaxID=2527980 RepID=A0A517R5Q1_9PLAN|nr:hypothetical protein [Stratiformator vulcanicus]QDT39218.1 hypothetical protein Pan189_36210 [Stratiformator vulcanicus]